MTPSATLTECLSGGQHGQGGLSVSSLDEFDQVQWFRKNFLSAR